MAKDTVHVSASPESFVVNYRIIEKVDIYTCRIIVTTDAYQFVSSFVAYTTVDRKLLVLVSLLS